MILDSTKPLSQIFFGGFSRIKIFQKNLIVQASLGKNPVNTQKQAGSKMNVGL